MKITVLGSGCLIPVPNRGNSAYLLQAGRHHILVDGGSGTLRGMADLGLDHRSIDVITYTHLHPDHTYDLVPLLFSFKYDPRVEMPKDLRIIAPRGFQAYFDALMDIYGDWVLPPRLNVQIEEVFRDTIKLEDLQIVVNHTEHVENSVSYRYVNGEGKAIFYSGDTDLCDELMTSARGANVLILECSFPDELKRTGHLTPSECGQIARETGCEWLILTHLYPEILQTDILSKVSEYFHGKTLVAYDGMEITV